VDWDYMLNTAEGHNDLLNYLDNGYLQEEMERERERNNNIR
jgi:hypothetical protein